MNNKNFFMALSYLESNLRSSSLVVMLRPALIIIGLATLTACGGGKKVTTVDKSAEYKSAVSLPPLKKPSNSGAPESVVLESDANRVSQDDDASQAYVPNRSDTAEAESLPVEQLKDETIDETTVATVNEDALATSSTSGVVNADSIRANVISPKSDVSRLQIEAKFDDAWAYLSKGLQRSDLTVFSRNKVAGLFAIGCSGINEATSTNKKGGWTFLNKRKKPQQEYCALQVVATRGVTVVTVLNRSSEEVKGESAGEVFSRVLNN